MNIHVESWHGRGLSLLDDEERNCRVMCVGLPMAFRQLSGVEGLGEGVESRAVLSYLLWPLGRSLHLGALASPPAKQGP